MAAVALEDFIKPLVKTRLVPVSERCLAILTVLLGTRILLYSALLIDFCKKVAAKVNIFRINPEFRILRLTY